MNIELLTPQSFSVQGKRQHQEDCLCPKQADSQSARFAVCDGVGGRSCGEVASQLVCDVIEQNLPNEQCALLKADDVITLTDLAYQALYQHRAISPEMATTLAFAAKTKEGMLIAHLGDSRIYQFRNGKGIIYQTTDHSLVQELLDKKLITTAEAETHPKRNVITKCLFVTSKQSDYKLPTITLIRNIHPGDIFMLCTDGVYTHLGNDALSALLTSQSSITEKAEQLAQRCQDSSDNSTGILLEVAKVEGDIDTQENISFAPPSASNKSWLKRLLSYFD